MAWQTVRQQPIYYESLGHGDAVLLLSGMIRPPTSSAHYRNPPGTLERQASRIIELLG